MSLVSVLVVAAALIGVGIYGALSQQTFVMIMMGFELTLNGVILAAGGLWRYAGGGGPDGQLLVVIVLLVMALEAALGFALVVALYRVRQVDMTDGANLLQR